MERLLEHMRGVGIVPCAATFLEALESFSLSNGSEEKLTESTVDVPAFNDDDDDDNNGLELNTTSCSDTLTFSNYADG